MVYEANVRVIFNILLTFFSVIHYFLGCIVFFCVGGCINVDGLRDWSGNPALCVAGSLCGVRYVCVVLARL